MEATLRPRLDTKLVTNTGRMLVTFELLGLLMRTPLLKQHKQTSLKVFDGHIHTYKFGEVVADDVMLKLVYEVREIDQRLGSHENVDVWFDAKTSGLNEW